MGKFKQTKRILYLGGKDGERLYLNDLKFKMADGTRVRVKKTMIPGKNSKDLIARSKGRYALLGLFSRPGYRVLDFPCGSGYVADFLKEFGIKYEGKECDKITVEYAKRMYGGSNTHFSFGDLCSSKLKIKYYDTIGCIEGLEHIDKEYQEPLIAELYSALKPGGTLIISSPENTEGVSGSSKVNPYHKWELTKNDFLNLLYTKFKSEEVVIVSYKVVLSYGAQLTTCFFGICHKEYEKEK
ncbi:class I SAM-dependent methyltransferase [Candidatus Woesearchaeota archaeon]|uniref:Methyltransferase domain-containing protein n=1 Tax=Candidatus Yanofskybacteria bacterium RIFOXYD1_FULL_42_10 TaxID=1802718 RepID=A0A1F8HSA0_9BACT|nr:class I SAM-dependent methyltransferase [Candidatus Woesearchaeota archaeon]OGN40451.1 MAG: hypothetical protein A2606_01660 [Candidatus Yanofskybacteria bacterium RIFOXYD1_FULL_42_10]